MALVELLVLAIEIRAVSAEIVQLRDESGAKLKQFPRRSSSILATVPSLIKLTKADAKRALAIHHFTLVETQMQVFDRLRSIQFDPIAPVGCNHDLVLQARLPDYKVGDWNQTAYIDRKVYDGWDKQASLVPYEGWPLRRLIHTIHRRHFEKTVFEDLKGAADSILKEIADRGPLLPKDLELQLRNPELKGSWSSPNVTKRILRAFWHSGIVMTTGRKNGQHLYDLTERVVPAHLLDQPRLLDDDARRELILERHRAMGIVRPNATAEIWSYGVLNYHKKEGVAELLDRGEIVPVDIEGIRVNATPDFFALFDQPAPEPRVTFVAPLDQFLWDRKLTALLHDFDYSWEIYIPEAKRRWGYYVLPILFGGDLVARVEFYCRGGILELRQWFFEPRDLAPNFWPELERALRQFMTYASATKITAAPHLDQKIRDLAESI